MKKEASLPTRKKWDKKHSASLILSSFLFGCQAASATYPETQRTLALDKSWKETIILLIISGQTRTVTIMAYRAFSHSPAAAAAAGI